MATTDDLDDIPIDGPSDPLHPNNIPHTVYRKRPTAAQLDALRHIARDGDVEALYLDGGPKGLHSALWFNRCDKVTGALLRRGWVTSDGRLGAQWELTATGREVLAQADR